MNDHERAITAAWLSEMWPTVRQYNAADPSPKRKPRKPRDKPDAPHEACPVCGNQFLSADVLTHILNSHPGSVKKAGDSDETGAA